MSLDREEQAVYDLIIEARDGSGRVFLSIINSLNSLVILL